MKKWGFWNNSPCPACGTPIEEGWHMFLCPDVRLRQAWLQGLQDFMSSLRDIHTAPFIQISMLSNLMRWRQHLPAHLPICQGATDQDTMGWKQVLLGRLACTWEEAQLQWALDQPTITRRHARTWFLRATQAALTFSFSVWLKRNAILHDENQPFLQLCNHDEDVDMRIAEEWFFGHQMLMPLDRHLLQGRSIESLLDKPPSMKRRWLETVQLSRDAFQLQT